jgi:tight adherence protein C
VVDAATSPDDPLTCELRCILRELGLGHTRRDALLRLGERLPDPEVAEFVASAVQAEERGTPLGDVLRTQAQAARSRRTLRAEQAAARAGVQMILPLVLVFLSILGLVLGPLLLTLEAGPGGGGSGW